MAKNFYNLPPPWNPGYAIPQSVLDEGLSRHTFTTAQLPRGTYDNVKTGTAGYAVPAYVMKEGTGRGTFTTAWLPRGYYGPKIPHYLDQQYTRVMPDGTPGNGVGQRYTASHLGAWPEGIQGNAPVRYANPDIWGTYGRQAADTIVRHVAAVPPAHQAVVMKQILSRIDPDLHGKVDTTVKQFRQQGIPLGKAVRAALAHHITQGTLTELARLGKTRRAPQPRSLLGLGCYGRQALGADPSLSLAATVSNFDPSLPNPPTGFTWVTDATALGGHWERLRAGQVPVPSPHGGATVQTATHAAASQAYGAAPDEPAQQLFSVGPFTMVNGASTHLAESAMTAEQRKALMQGIVWMLQTVAPGIRMPSTISASAPVFQQIFDANPGWGGAGQSATAAAQGAATNAMLIPGLIRNMFAGKVPLYRFTNPVDGSDSGLYFTSDPNVKTANTAMWLIEARPRNWQDLTLLTVAWNGIKELAAAIIKVAAAALDAISTLACQTLSKPGAAAGASAAAMTAGPAGMAAGVGVQIAAGLCGGSAVPPPMVAAPSLTTPLMIAGLAIVGIAIMKKHKKKTTTQKGPTKP